MEPWRGAGKPGRENCPGDGGLHGHAGPAAGEGRERAQLGGGCVWTG